MNEFLNPKSMVTPGVAGATVMLVANAICSQFPEITFRWTAISLSFIVGAVVFSSAELKLIHRVIFWAVNSLIIFSVGIGTSNIAANVQQKPAQPDQADASWMLNAFFSVASAQDLPTEVAPISPTQDIGSQLKAIKATLEQQIKLNRSLQTENQQLGAELKKVREQTKPVSAVQIEGLSPEDIKRLEEERQRAEEAQRRAAEEAQRVKQEAERAATEYARLEALRMALEQRSQEEAVQRSRETAIRSQEKDGFFNRW